MVSYAVWKGGPATGPADEVYSEWGWDDRHCRVSCALLRFTMSSKRGTDLLVQHEVRDPLYEHCTLVSTGTSCSCWRSPVFRRDEATVESGYNECPKSSIKFRYSQVEFEAIM